MQDNPYQTPFEVNSYFEKRPGLLVLSSGVVTSLLTLALLYYLDHTTRFHVMGFYVNLILPVGAFIVGMLAGSSYGLSSWLSGVKISQGLLLTVAVLQIVMYFTAQYVEYWLIDQQLPGGLQMSFWQYFDAVSRAFAWEKNGKAGEPFGLWGYGMRLLEIAGFVGGRLIAPAALHGIPYCDACQVYMGTRNVALVPASRPARTFKKKEAAAKAEYERDSQLVFEQGRQIVAQMVGCLETRDLAGLAKLISDHKWVKSAAKANNHFRVDIARCKRCSSGRLLLNLLTKNGEYFATTKISATPIDGSSLGELETLLKKVWTV